MDLRTFALALAGAALAAQADFAVPGPGAALPPALARDLGPLKAQALGAHIRFLAAPALEGRGLGSRGLEAAAEYAAAHLALAGLAPFGDGPGSFFQAVPLRRVERAEARLLLHRTGGGGLAFLPGATAVFPHRGPGTVSGPLVYAGYGIQEEGRDDLKGLEVRGKVVVLMGGLPPEARWQTPEWTAKYAAEDREDRYEARLALLQRLGAAAVVALEEDFPAAAKATALAAEPFFLPPEAAGPPEGLPLVRLAAAAGRPLASAEGTLTLAFAGTPRPALSRNVLAVLPGTDPRLKDEAVVLGAHLDHLGVVAGAAHPGADDNASGVAALLELARAFAARGPLRRTLVIAFWTGEEEAKFGSSHYARHPRWPLARTRAYLNLDMIGHPWTPQELRKLVAEAWPGPGGAAFLAATKAEDFIEPGVAKGAPWLGPVLAEAGKGLGTPLHLDWTEGVNGGSDYRPFARAGVPFVRFFGNYFPGYHTPGDTADQVDPAQVLKVARLAFATAWLLAER